MQNKNLQIRNSGIFFAKYMDKNEQPEVSGWMLAPKTTSLTKPQLSHIYAFSVDMRHHLLFHTTRMKGDLAN